MMQRVPPNRLPAHGPLKPLVKAGLPAGYAAYSHAIDPCTEMVPTTLVATYSLLAAKVLMAPDARCRCWHMGRHILPTQFSSLELCKMLPYGARTICPKITFLWLSEDAYIAYPFSRRAKVVRMKSGINSECCHFAMC